MDKKPLSKVPALPRLVSQGPDSNIAKLVERVKHTAKLISLEL